MKLPLAALFALAIGIGVAQAADFQEGVHFRRIPSPQPTNVKSGQVEVLEFFSWGCPHCYTFEPFLQQGFIKQKPANVVFTRVPAVFNPAFKPLAKAYYVAEALGIEAKVNMPMFDELHAPGSNGPVRRALAGLLNAKGDDASAKAELAFEDALAAFFVKHGGIKEQDFRATFKSFAIGAKMQRADATYRRYQISGVPNVIIGGTFFIGGGAGLQIDTYAKYAEVVRWLAAREAATAR